MSPRGRVERAVYLALWPRATPELGSRPVGPVPDGLSRDGVSSGKPSGLGPCFCFLSWVSPTWGSGSPPFVLLLATLPEHGSTFRGVGESPTTFGLAPSQGQPALASVVKAGLSGLPPGPSWSWAQRATSPRQAVAAGWNVVERLPSRPKPGRPVSGVPAAVSTARGPTGSPGSSRARSGYQETTGHLSAPVE